MPCLLVRSGFQIAGLTREKCFDLVAGHISSEGCSDEAEDTVTIRRRATIRTILLSFRWANETRQYRTRIGHPSVTALDDAPLAVYLSGQRVSSP